MKEHVSLTIDSNVLREIDKTVDGIFVRSRSDAIEKVLKEHVMSRKTAVILAGGKPERLFIKELNTYRPLVDIERKKLIEDTVEKCRESGFVNIIVIGFSGLLSKLYEVLGNGEKYGVNILYIEENRELGSAKSLELAKKHIKTDFLFLPCDFFIDFDLRKLLEFHIQHNGATTIGIHTRTTYNWKRGIVEMDGFRVTNYEENPKKPKTRLVGIFTGFMKPEIFNNIPPGEIYWSLQEHVFPKLAKEGKLIGYPISGNWVNVHEVEDVRNVIKLKKKEK